jgi:hypothetical protein
MRRDNHHLESIRLPAISTHSDGDVSAEMAKVRVHAASSGVDP